MPPPLPPLAVWAKLAAVATTELDAHTAPPSPLAPRLLVRVKATPLSATCADRTAPPQSCKGRRGAEVAVKRLSRRIPVASHVLWPRGHDRTLPDDVSRNELLVALTAAFELTAPPPPALEEL